MSMKLKKNNLSGQSIVEVLVGAGILLMAGAIAVSISLQSKKINKKADDKSASTSFAGDLASLGRKMFLPSPNSDGTRTEGLCAYMVTAGSSGGVSNIYLNIPAKDGSLSKAWDATASNSNWSLLKDVADEAPCSGASSDFNKCFIHKVYQGNVTDPQTKQVTYSQKVMGSIKIIPQYLDEKREQGFLFQDLKDSQRGQNLDVKRVSFRIVAKVTTYSADGSGAGVTNDYETLIWGADAGVCDKNGYKLAPSGSGQGDPKGKTIYNDTAFTPEGDKVFTGTWEKRQIQAGTLEGGLIRTDSKSNIEMACNETRFTCTNEDYSKRQFASNIEANLALVYNDKNKQGIRDGSVVAVPWLEFRDLASNNETIKVSGKDFNLRLDETAFVFNDKDGLYYTPDLKNQMRVTGGSHQLFMYANNDTTKVCSTFCSADDAAYRPSLHYKLPAFKNGKKVFEEEIPSTAELGCTVCYMKDCKRYGLKTFGPLKGSGRIIQPDEPLDGTIPECAIKSDSDVNALVLKLDSYTSTGEGSCISGKVESKANGAFSYQRQNCTSSLPVMCFAYGKFTLAENKAISGSAHDSIPQSLASSRCYQMGKEKLSKKNLNGLVDQSYPNDSSTASQVKAVISAVPGNDDVTIVNNAVQGIFLAPQSERQRVYAAEWIAEKHASVMGNRFWLGLRADSMGNPYSEIPWIQSISDTENKLENQFSIFFNTSSPSQISVLRHEKGLKDLNIVAPTGAGAGALISHHVRYKGVIPVKAEQSAEFSFICRKKAAPYTFFVSSEKNSKQSAGPDVCLRAQGWFLPPVTPLQWAKVFHLVKENHFNYSFPDPEGAVGFAWIALTGDGSKRTESWNVYSGGEMGQFQASLAKATLKQVYRSGEEVVPSSTTGNSPSSSSNTSAVETILPFTCSATTNAGCQGNIPECPKDTSITGIKAACNLETPDPIATLDKLGWNLLSVERASDVVSDGHCKINNTDISSGEKTLDPAEFSTAGKTFFCKENDNFSGGECSVKGSVKCSPSSTASSATPSPADNAPSVESAYACFKSDGTIFLDSKANCGGNGTRLTRADMKSFVVQALWLLGSDDSKVKGILLD